MGYKSMLAALFLVSLSGCFSRDPISLNSDKAPNLIPAIKNAAARNDRAAIPKIIEELDNNDPAIRFAAITALYRMTHQTLGYQYYDSEDDRRQAVARWQKWLKDQPPIAQNATMTQANR